MAFAIVTAPAVEPLTVQEAKDHLRVIGADDDAYIEPLIVAARQEAEDFTGRALLTQTWDWTRDSFPAGGGPLFVPKAPLQSVTSISYIDTAGASQTWASAKYKVDTASEPARIMPAFGETYPTTRAEIDAVTIRVVAGWTIETAIPETIRQGMKMLIGHWFEHRESVLTGTTVAIMPLATERLWFPHKVGWAS